MTRNLIRQLAVLIVAASALAQQPNDATHSMTIDGSAGPPYPIATTVRTNTATVITVRGAPQRPYAIYQAANVAAGSATLGGSIVDLPMSPIPECVIDGFVLPTFQTAGNGTSTIALLVPDAGAGPGLVPLGLHVALQAVIADPISAAGYSLTAATQITVTQGPFVQSYFLGDEYEQHLTFPSMPLPFYGTNYTGVYVGSNGYVCFGTSLGSDPTSSPQDMLTGPPRIAAQWCDMVCPPNTVRTTIDPNPGPGMPGYVRIDYLNVQDYIIPVPHTFSIVIRTDGYVEINSPITNNASHFDQTTGIAPGFGLGGINQAQKNFTGPQPAGSTLGPGILSTPPYAYVGGINEAFFEWHGITTQNIAYLETYDNPYDLTGTTLHFLPGGAGWLPGSTSRYTLY